MSTSVTQSTRAVQKHWVCDVKQTAVTEEKQGGREVSFGEKMGRLSPGARVSPGVSVRRSSGAS